MKERLGEWDAAMSQYVGLADDRSVIAAEDDHTAQALFRLGAILYDQLQRQEEALDIWKLVVAYYPDCDGPARRALDGLVVHWERHGLHGEAVHYFEESYRSLAATRMGDNLLYWLGYWYRQHLGDEGRAYSVFGQLRDLYYDISSLRDDAEWQMVELLHGWGEYKREIDLLRAIADERDANFLFGSNATTSMENAAFRIGVVMQADVGDLRGAIGEFQQFLDGWQLSLYRDDAAYHILQLTLALGDFEEASRLAGRFLLDYPESRHCEEALQMAGELEEGEP